MTCRRQPRSWDPNLQFPVAAAANERQFLYVVHASLPAPNRSYDLIGEKFFSKNKNAIFFFWRNPDPLRILQMYPELACDLEMSPRIITILSS